MPSATLGDWPSRECLGVPWGVDVPDDRGAFIGIDGVWEDSPDFLDRSDASDRSGEGITGAGVVVGGVEELP